MEIVKLRNQTLIFTQLAREAIIMGETKRAIFNVRKYSKK